MATTDRDILPGLVVPVNYAISLYDLELGGAFTYEGSVNITAKIVRSSKSITLSSFELKIHSAVVLVEHTKIQQQIESSEITYDTAKQRATIQFSQELPPSGNAVIVIKFQGIMNDNLAGFYRSKYKTAATPASSVPKDGDSHYMFSTQFEDSYARRAFPCFDEPNLKATFDFQLELPDDQVALSNMPERSVQKTKPGLKVVSFERTPIMSTYLLAWAFGDFEYVEDFTKRKYNGKSLPVRAYTTKGLKEQARFALEHAHQIVDYFSEIFKIDYPLPKIDLLAVPEFSHGAMENWGLITFRTTTILFDEKLSDASYRNTVAYVVAHELAHQWFGNLVTMDWWSELWLNEGFATWVGWVATDYLHPEWNVWPQFVTSSMQTAFGLDALRSSHPIEVPVKDALDIGQIFDAISYLKGSSVIRMLATHLGIETFLTGVSNYLKAHAYGNATTSDLWSALSDASGQDVQGLMDPWIKNIGYPVITIAEETGQISIRQSRYLSTGDVKSEDDQTCWWVPLGLKGKVDSNGTNSITLTAKEDIIKDIDDSFYKLNADNTGFFCTNYPPARLAQLGRQVKQLTISDKIGLIGDTGALALSGESTTPSLLAFVEGFSAEDNYLVWSQIASSLGTIKSIFSEDDEILNGLKAFILKLINDAVSKIGWDFVPGEDYLTGQLRALLISTAGLNGNESVIAVAKQKFNSYLAGDATAIHPNLRASIFRIAIRYGAESEYAALIKEWSTTSSIDGREIVLEALGHIQTPTLLASFFTFLFTSVPTHETKFAATSLAANGKARLGLWQYIKENWEQIRERLGSNIVLLDRFLQASLQGFSDEAVGKDIAAFFDGKDNRGYDRSLAVINDTIKGRAAYKKRDRKVLLEWLKGHGYA